MARGYSKMRGTCTPQYSYAHAAPRWSRVDEHRKPDCVTADRENGPRRRAERMAYRSCGYPSRSTTMQAPHGYTECSLESLGRKSGTGGGADRDPKTLKHCRRRRPSSDDEVGNRPRRPWRSWCSTIERERMSILIPREENSCPTGVFWTGVQVLDRREVLRHPAVAGTVRRPSGRAVSSSRPDPTVILARSFRPEPEVDSGSSRIVRSHPFEGQNCSVREIPRRRRPVIFGIRRLRTGSELRHGKIRRRNDAG